MEIVVRGRHLTQDVGESFRQHCQTKLERLGRLDHRLRRLDVELSHETNPRQHGHCQRVEITVHTRGPVVRAEAAAAECYAAFEAAFAKLEERMRRAQDRRMASHSHSHHQHLPVTEASLPEIVSSLPGEPAGVPATPVAPDEEPPERLRVADLHELDGGLIVREKFHRAEPLTLQEAVHRMELVGHDFYLFCDAETGVPSVVYARRGYNYGVLRLSAADVVADAPAAPGADQDATAGATAPTAAPAAGLAAGGATAAGAATTGAAVTAAAAPAKAQAPPARVGSPVLAAALA